MGSSIKISIIVPIYNCQQYLSECLDSLIHQTYKNIEILLIDDGSTDSSASICDEYEKEDSRVRVVHKENGGVSSARNTGIRLATGDYVIFVDADDWLDLDACEKINTQQQDNINLSFWACWLGECNFLPITKRTTLETTVADIIACNGKEQSSYIRASWAKVYKRDFLKYILFPESFYIGEDACFLLDCLNNVMDVSHVVFINDGWYHYRILQNSAVRKYKVDLFDQSIKQYTYIKTMLSKMNLQSQKIIKTAETMFCWQVFCDLKRNSMKRQSRENIYSMDCIQWAQLTDTQLRNSKIRLHSLSKLQLVCWILYKTCGEKAVEKICEFVIGKK